MYLPNLTEGAKYQDFSLEFKGYNHNLYVGAGQFYDMQNLTSKYYPVLSPRAPRAKLRRLQKPNGLFAKGKLCWVDGADFYYDGAVRGSVTDGSKQFVGMGACILIFPDKARFNTDTLQFDSLGSRHQADGEVTISPCKADGSDPGEYTASATAPESPANGDLWLDTGATPNALKQYSSTSATWVSVPTSYVKIAATGIGANFSVGDGVQISGAAEQSLNSANVIAALHDHYIVVTGIVASAAAQSGGLIVERRIPDMDFVTELNNRVWGCSSQNHEIYACKLGDPTNWYTYAGISTDSYALTIGSDGDFTGACTHLGSVLFFKQHVVHRLMGAKPANFQLADTRLRGVQKGSEASLALLNETLYYKSAGGVCAFDGSLPAELSRELGPGGFDCACAGAFGGRYYVSMRDGCAGWHLFVYDEATGMWHREDATHALFIAQLEDELYFVDADGWLWAVNGSMDGYADPETATPEDPVEWYAETGDIGVELPGHKYVSKLQIRLSVDEGASMKASVQYDSSGVWAEKFSIAPGPRRSCTVPLIPIRCDHMRVKLAGVGGCKVYSMSKLIEQGSEL